MGIGDWVSGVFGSKNEERAKGYDVDPNAYEYGGKPGGAEEQAYQMELDQQRANAKADEYSAQQQNLYNRGNAGMDQAQDARGMQMDAAGMARARATGAVPSIAQMQADRQMGQATAAQTSAAASARGPGALALAQQQAAGNTAAAHANISGQAQIAAAQERLAAEQAYAQQSGAIRGGDFQGAQTAYGASGQAGQLGLGQGQLGLGYAGQEAGIRQSQLGAQQNQQAQKSANALGAQGINAGVGGQNAQTNQQNAMGLMGTASSAAGTAATALSDERAKMSPGDFVASTWGRGSAPSDADQRAASTALNVAFAPRERPIFQDPNAEDRQNAAGGGYMLGKQLGTALYGGRADGSLPSSVAAGMKSTGTSEKAEGKRDEKAQAATKDKQSKAVKAIDDIADRASKMASSVDTRYHAGLGYVPPQLLAMPSDMTGKTMPSDMLGKTPSDERMKIPVFGGGGLNDATAKYDFQKTAMSPSSGSGAASFDVLGAGGASMDVGATDAKHKAFGTRFNTNASAGTQFTSDERAKNPTGVLGLDDPNLRVSDAGRAYIAQDEQPQDKWKAMADRETGRARGASPGDMVAAMAPKKAHAGGVRKQPDDDLMRKAMAMMGGIQSQTQGQLANGPAVRPDGSTMVSDKHAKAQAWDEGYAAATGDVKKMGSMNAEQLKGAAANRPIASAFRDAKASAWDEGRTAQAARALASEPYVYKPGMTPPEQAPGELNVGPMAQNMARDPVAGTAIIKQPNGMLAIDIPKYTKVLGAVAAGQQDQIDEQDQQIAHLSRVLGRRK